MVEKIRIISNKTIVLFMLICILHTTVFAESSTNGFCGENVTWNWNSDTKVLTISGNGEMNKYGYSLGVDIPWRDYISEIETIIVQNGVKSIGEYAFEGCENLIDINISDSVVSIGNSAFRNCKSLKNINIPNNVTSIGVGAFAECDNLTDINIPNGLTNISGSLFAYCSSLARVGIPSSVTKIEWRAFNGCDNLTDVYYSGSEMQWQDIYVDVKNIPLKLAYIHYDSIISENIELGDAVYNYEEKNAFPTNDRLYVNDVAELLEVYKIDGNNYFKLRDIAFLLKGTNKHFSVDYGSSSKWIILTSGGSYESTKLELSEQLESTAIKATKSNDIFILNGKRLEIDTYKINGNNYVKLRDIGQALDFYVAYDKGRILILTDKGYRS